MSKAILISEKESLDISVRVSRPSDENLSVTVPRESPLSNIIL